MNYLSRFLMSSALCAVCTIANAQQVNVSGVVTDPITGETIIPDFVIASPKILYQRV